MRPAKGINMNADACNKQSQIQTASDWIVMKEKSFREVALIPHRTIY
jgi:hypothetical protein